MSAWSSDEDVRLPPSGGAGLPSPTPGPDPAEEKFKRRAEAAFNFFGEKHQGSVMMTRKQLLEASHYLGYNPTKKELRDVGKKKKGSPTDPCFNFDDFAEFVGSQKRTTPRDLMSAFRIIDENGDGQLSTAELEVMLTNFGERMSKSEVKAVMGMFDKDASGSIDFTEFCDMLVTMGEVSESHHGDGPNRARLPTENLLDDPAMLGVDRELDADDADLPEWYAEPGDLLEWCGDRLHGSFQVGNAAGHVLSQLYSFTLREPDEVFLSLRMTREKTQPNTVDARFYLIRMILGHDGASYPELVASSQLLATSDPALRLELDAGTYVIVPFSTGCHLRPRASGGSGKLPPLIVQGPDDTETLSTPFRDALAYTFGRFDFDGTGMLSRSEFSMRTLYVDGEVCSDEVWQAVLEHFDVVEGELTFEGFCQLHEMALRGDLADGRTEADFYDRNLRPLGLSPSLVPDHVAKFVLFCFTRKPREGLLALPANERLCEQVDLLDILETGQRRPGLSDGLELYTRQDGNHASYAIKNSGRIPRRCALNFHNSINCVINKDSLDVRVHVPLGGAVVACHLIPTPHTSKWKPVVECNAL